MHAWAAIRQSHRLEETYRTEWRPNMNTVIAIILYAWIVRYIDLFDNVKSNVLHCRFVSVDA